MTSDTPTDDVLVAREGRVATITLNRPHVRNAVKREMWAVIRDRVLELADDDAVGAIVLTGAGDAFCAGGDVKDMAGRLTEARTTTLDEEAAYIREIVEASRALHVAPKVTIAAINGAAAGAGLSLALACDLRVMVAEAKMTTAFANIALSGDFGGAWFMSRLVGDARARELFYLAPVLTGTEAAALGVVNRAVPREAFAETLREVAERVAHGPTAALSAMKANFVDAARLPLDDYLTVEARRMSAAFHTADHREAAMAFVEKRKPNFTGK